MASPRRATTSRPHPALSHATPASSTGRTTDRLTTCSPEIRDDAADRRRRLRYNRAAREQCLERIAKIVRRRPGTSAAELHVSIIDSTAIDQSRTSVAAGRIHGRFRRDGYAAEFNERVSWITQRRRVLLVLREMRANRSRCLGGIDIDEPEPDTAWLEFTAKPLDRWCEAIRNRAVDSGEHEDRGTRRGSDAKRIDWAAVETLQIERLSIRSRQRKQLQEQNENCRRSDSHGADYGSR